MNSIASDNQDSPIKDLVLSIALHMLVVAFFTVKAVFFPTDPIIVQSAIKVDLVGMPEKKVGSPKAKAKRVEAPKVNVETNKPKAKVTKKPKVDTNAQNSAIARLKALEKLKKQQKAVEKEGTSNQVKGNIISPGTKLEGLDKLHHADYLNDVKSHAQQYWELPEWLAKQDLKARVRVYLDDRGYVIKKNLSVSSGNQMFDSKALEAVEKASPFPEPPTKFRAILSVQGMVLGFPE